MLSAEKKSLFNLINDSIDRDISKDDLATEEKTPKFRSFLKKDDQDCYCLLDNETSIKCVFNEKNLREYLASLPSYITYDSFDSKIYLTTGYSILLKKYRFDYVLVKVSEETNAIRVIVYIEDFEIDRTQKSPYDHLPVNINVNATVKGKLMNVMHKFEKVYEINLTHSH
jgi:hypothetical protein